MKTVVLAHPTAQKSWFRRWDVEAPNFFYFFPSQTFKPNPRWFSQLTLFRGVEVCGSQSGSNLSRLLAQQHVLRDAGRRFWNLGWVLSQDNQPHAQPRITQSDWPLSTMQSHMPQVFVVNTFISPRYFVPKMTIYDKYW